MIKNLPSISERAVLQGIISKDREYYKYFNILTPELFHDDINKNIFKIVTKMNVENIKPSLFNISKELTLIYPETQQSSWIKNVTDLLSFNCQGVRFNEAIEYLRDNYIREQYQMLLLNKANRIGTDDIKELIKETQKELAALTDVELNSSKTFKDNLEEVKENIKINQNPDKKLTGINTGYDFLNYKTGGWQKGNLIIIAGKTSMGKTAFMLSGLNNYARIEPSFNPFVKSIEMTNIEMCSRLISHDSNISSNRILYSKLGDFELNNVEGVINDISKRNFIIDSHYSAELDIILNSIRAEKIINNIPLAVVDFLQNITFKQKGTKEEMLANAVGSFKSLAMELQIPIILISQLNRNESNEEPTLNMLRGSGQIEEKADIVLFVYRPEYYGNEFINVFYDNADREISSFNKAKIICAKGRSIGTFEFVLSFDKELTLFSDYTITPSDYLSMPEPKKRDRI